MYFSQLITLQALSSMILAIPTGSNTLSNNMIKQHSTTPNVDVQVVGFPLSTSEAVTPKPLQKRYTPTTIPADYASTVVTYHNYHRTNHTAIALTYSSTLAGYAQQLASSCKYGHDTTIGGGGYGQNIAAIGSSSSTYGSKNPSTVAAYATTEQWYNGEINAFLLSQYGLASPNMTDFAKWGHMTQVVWNGTRTVGCATQYCPTGTVFGAPFTSWYTVCNYGPPGNYLNKFDVNVFKPSGNAKTVHVVV